jgi:hypothetical protein
MEIKNAGLVVGIWGLRAVDMRAKVLGFSVVLLMAVILLLLCMSVMGQNSDEQTRRLWDTAFIAKKKTSRRRPGRRTYRIATPKIPVDDVAPDSVVGVTIWRLRPATTRDSGERIIVHDEMATKEWLPERISPETRLAQGDKLRISVEGARRGYLYVIDREQYADGSLGEPYMIFPTTRTLNGDNQVDIGRLTEIPAQTDSPPYFTVRKTRPDHVAEVLSVLVTPTPLEGVSIADKAQKLTDTQVATWEKQWSTGVGFLEMEKTAGQAWTKEERDAAGTRALTASGPAPQLVFYRAAARANQPLFVRMHLWYRTARRRKEH